MPLVTGVSLLMNMHGLVFVFKYSNEHLLNLITIRTGITVCF